MIVWVAWLLRVGWADLLVSSCMDYFIFISYFGGVTCISDCTALMTLNKQPPFFNNVRWFCNYPILSGC